MEVKRYPTINYYISEEQEEKLLDQEPFPLPEGYDLGKSTIEDAPLITSCWRHNAPGEEDQMRLKIAKFPATCIRYKGKPIAFETVHSCGMLSHLYVDPEHRGKNLGHIVQENMARELIKRGLYVYKAVETFNTAVIRGTNKWDLWSMKKKPDGSPLIKMFMDIYPEK